MTLSDGRGALTTVYVMRVDDHVTIYATFAGGTSALHLRPGDAIRISKALEDACRPTMPGMRGMESAGEVLPDV